MEIKLIRERIIQLCKERSWSYYRLAKEAGFQQATLKPILKEQNMPSLYTLDRICNGFNISLYDFFNSELFKSDNIPSEDFFNLWNRLSLYEKELTKAYMNGLLHIKMNGDLK